MDKVDLVMWAKNGSRTLDPVLQRISQVVPKEVVNHKILVDDKSTDNTPEIAKKYGWSVYPNRGVGISDGANTALSYVSTEYFLSFEQDLLLAPQWWSKIPAYLGDSKNRRCIRNTLRRWTARRQKDADVRYKKIHR